MDSSFLDLDILMTRIREPLSKRYFLEAARSYKAGALRSCISSAWVAVVYDLISKYRELSAMGDAPAAAFLQKWDQAMENKNVSKLLELERTILEDATQNTQVLNQMAEDQLKRLREDRNLCAHPAFSEVASLFEPTPELARLHLVNAIDLVLSQQPLQGKAVLEQFSADIQSPGFPANAARVPDYVEQRYIQHIRPQNIKNLGVVLAKALIKGTPPEWQPHLSKVRVSLEVIRDRAPDTWDDISTNIVQWLNVTVPALRTRAIAFIAAFPMFWDRVSAPTRTALQETAANIEPDMLTEYQILAAASLPALRGSILELIGRLSSAQVMEALRLAPFDDLWSPALAAYEASRSFRASEVNFRDFILPFARKMTTARYNELLQVIVGNRQNAEASGTPGLLLALLRDSETRDFPTREVRQQFVLQLTRWLLRDDFAYVIEALQSDGWQAPPPPEHEDEPPF
jgi:hypothetical protein